MFVTPLCLDNLLHCSRFDKEDKIYATEVALKTQKNPLTEKNSYTFSMKALTQLSISLRTSMISIREL